MDRVNTLQLISDILAAKIDEVGIFNLPQSFHSFFNKITYDLINAREDAGL